MMHEMRRIRNLYKTTEKGMELQPESEANRDGMKGGWADLGPTMTDHVDGHFQPYLHNCQFGSLGRR